MPAREEVAGVTAGGAARRRLAQPGGPGHRVTPLELFFDLVFVFAFTQVTAMVASSADARGALRGLVLSALLWWIWCSYSWLGNQARADEGMVRHALFVAMAAVMLLALAIPRAWADSGRDGALVLAVCTLVVQWVHLSVYAVAAAGDRGLQRQLMSFVVPVFVGNALILVGAFAGPQARFWWWAGGMSVNYTGIYAAGLVGWRLPSPAHFAERYALIVLVALGESVVAVGVGVGVQTLTPALIAATGTAIVLAITLWWLYFDVLAPAAEHHVVTASSLRARTALARDVFTFMHFPVVLSILGLAVGIKKVFVSVSASTQEPLAHGMHALPAALLAGGPAVFLLVVSLLHRRIHGLLDLRLMLAAAALAVLAGLAAGGMLDGRMPPLGYLVVVTAFMVFVVVQAHRSQGHLRRFYRYGEISLEAARSRS